MLRALALAGAVVLLGTVTACSSDSAGDGASTEAYCQELQDTQQEFASLESGNVSGANLERVFTRMQELADIAPPAVSEEWATMDRAINELEKGLEDLGIGFTDLTDPSKLAEIDPQKAQELGEKFKRISSGEFDKAGKAIQRHARQECGIKGFGTG